MRSLNVSREYHGSYELVGRLEKSGRGGEEGPRFSYDPAYLNRSTAAPISGSMPLVSGRFSARETRAFFDGLIPEGPMREAFERSTRAGRNDFLPFLRLCATSRLAL